MQALHWKEGEQRAKKREDEERVRLESTFYKRVNGTTSRQLRTSLSDPEEIRSRGGGEIEENVIRTTSRVMNEVTDETSEKASGGRFATFRNVSLYVPLLPFSPASASRQTWSRGRRSLADVAARSTKIRRQSD